MPAASKVPARYARTLRLFTLAWNTNDPKQRERLVRGTCSPGLEVSSPYGVLHGTRAQLRSIADVRARFPRLKTGGAILGAHHRVVLSTWRTAFGTARRALTGIDCYEFDERGRIVRVVSFSPVSAGSVTREIMASALSKTSRILRRRTRSLSNGNPSRSVSGQAKTPDG